MAQNLDKNTTQTESTFVSNVVVGPEETIRSSLLISEEQVDVDFESKLKEEIAAQSLILSALSGENIGTSHTVQITSSTHHQPTAADILIAAQNDQAVDLKSNQDEQYEQGQHDQRNDLSFDVSQAIGVEMIAIQQQQQPTHSQTVIETTLESQPNSNEITITENQEDKGNDGLFNRQLASTLLEASLDSGSPVVLNAIAIKGENGVTEIQFENGSEIQMEQSEVDSNSQHQAQTIENSVLIETQTPTTTTSESIIDQKYPQLFIATTAQEAHEIIKKYAEETMSTFVSMRKMKQYGITEGGIDLKKKNYRVFFESGDVEFDGIPYVYVADKMYICHLGKDKTEVTRQKIRQQSLERRAKMGLPIKDLTPNRVRTKKIDCPVKITVKMIAKFPQFKVLRKTKRVCETASKKVRQALLETDGKLNCYYSFVGRLPSTVEHNHLVGEENAEHEPIDPLIKDKIIQLTWEGVSSSGEVKKQLEEYVEFDLFAGKPLPAKTRRRYYPNVKDIRNYMNKAKMLTRLSGDLRVELQDLANKLQQSRPTENIILQPEIVDNQESLLHLKTAADETQSHKPTLIFCHQTSQQQRLLKRYGSQVILCEVTNLIERVPFPLFSLFVQTNVDYQVVATFIVEIRNKESILQGLNSVKDWNPSWVPKYIIIDYSDDQIEAAKVVFPACQQFISESSRERNWRQWLSKADHKVNGDPSKVFLQFQAIANSYNEDVLHQAALQLENSEIWRESASLRSWFNSNWLLEAKKWVVGYRPDDFIVTLHNESTLDQDIRSLREGHMHFMRGKKLGCLIEKLVDRMIPDFYRRYIELNRKSYTQANELKVLYGDQLPTCLVNKPASVIVHVLDQIKSTESTVYQVSHVQPGVFWVQDASGSEASDQAHTVSFGDATTLPSCDCLDWQQYRLPCKHLCSVFSSFPDWGWDMLNAVYTANPLINLDYSCIKPWVDAQDKQDQRLGHFNPLTNLKAKSSGSSDKPVLGGGDIKISGIELEVPVMDKETSEETTASANPLTSASAIATIEDLEADDDEETADIALQCRDLLTNLAHLSSKRKHDQIEKLKADLEASIRMLQQSNEEDEDLEGVGDEELPAAPKRHLPAEDEEEEQDDIKRLKVDLDRSESDAEGSYMSEEEEAVGVPVDDIEDETIEITTAELEEEEELAAKLSAALEASKVKEEVLNNEDVPIQTILTRPPPVVELTPEQRERKLLAILTANTV